MSKKCKKSGPVVLLCFTNNTGNPYMSRDIAILSTNEIAGRTEIHTFPWRHVIIIAIFSINVAYLGRRRALWEICFWWWRSEKWLSRRTIDRGRNLTFIFKIKPNKTILYGYWIINNVYKYHAAMILFLDLLPATIIIRRFIMLNLTQLTNPTEIKVHIIKIAANVYIYFLLKLDPQNTN